MTTDKDMKRLSRAELIEIIYELQKQHEQDNELLVQAKDALDKKRLEIENAGSIAEAALKINGIFESAQKAAEQYLLSIEETAKERDEKIAEAEKKSTEIVNAAEEKSAEIVKEAEDKATEIIAEAESKAREQWEQFEKHAQEMIETHAALQSLIQRN